MEAQEVKRRGVLLRSLALEAGRFLAKSFGKINVSHAKTKLGLAANLVSEADTEAQNRIVSGIRKYFPQDQIFAEEGDLARAKEEMNRGFLWVIDPLDGTVNFLHGFPIYAVSIACCKDGEPILGAILDPSRRELFWAEKGRGAALTQFGDSRLIRAVSRRPMRVSAAKSVSESLLITGFGYDRKEQADFYLGLYKSFLRVCHDVRRVGAACVDLAWVAAGRADGFWEARLQPWDVAAGMLLVKEAGGRVTHFDGSPYSIFKNSETLATNGSIHAESLKIIQKTLFSSSPR